MNVGFNKMRKKLMFVFSLISLCGLMIGYHDADRYINQKFVFFEFIEMWFLFSLPLLIQFIYILIFRKR